MFKPIYKFINLDKVDWQILSENPNAIHLLCSLDYEKTKEANEPFREELMEYVFHPDRMIRIAHQHGLDLREHLDFY